MMAALLSLVMAIASFITTCDAKPRLIDLTHAIDENTTPNFPLTPRFNLTNVVHLIINNDTAIFDVNIYSNIEHGATHIDAPNHITPVGNGTYSSVGEVPLENTIGPGVMIDCRREAQADSSYVVPVQKILDWESQYGRIPSGAAVLFNFGYSRYFKDNQTFYRGTDNLEDFLTYNYPSVSAEAGRFLSEQRNMLIIGVDTVSPDIPSVNGELSTFPIHRMQFAKNRIIVENLNNLDALPARGFLFSVAPSKFIGPTGLQVRAYAAIFEEDMGPPPPMGGHGGHRGGHNGGHRGGHRGEHRGGHRGGHRGRH